MSSSGEEGKGRHTARATVPGAISFPAIEEPEPAVVPRAPVPTQDNTPENARRTVKAFVPGRVDVVAEEPESVVSNDARQPVTHDKQRTTAPNTRTGAVSVGAEEPDSLAGTTAAVSLLAPPSGKGSRTTAPAARPGAVAVAAEEPESVVSNVARQSVTHDKQRTTAPNARTGAVSDGIAKKTAGAADTGATPGAQSATSNEAQDSIALRKDPRARHVQQSQKAAATQKAAVADAVVDGAGATNANSTPTSALDDAEYWRRLENKVKESEYEYLGVTDVDNTSAFDHGRNPTDSDTGLPYFLHDEKDPNMAPFQPDLEPTAGVINPAYRAAAPLITTAARGVSVVPDLDYGATVYGGPELSGLPADDSLAVAIAVTEEDDDILLPAAVEYDPDAKPPLLKNRRFLLYAISAVLLCIAVIIVVILGVVVFKQDPPPPATYAPTGAPSFAPSSLLEGQYRDQFIAAVGPMVSVPNYPQERAARWIIEEDERNLAVDDPSLVQRYILALFYFTTTNNLESRWPSCNPHPTDSSITACEYRRFIMRSKTDDAIMVYIPEPSVRWLSSEDECSWAGIVCAGNKLIHAIDLLGQNITGTIPTELAVLPLLHSIALALNDFTGTLPAVFASMRHLISLEVHENQLTGTFPGEYFQTNALENLNIGDNQFTGTLSTEIGLLTNLKGLQTYANFFSGTFPTEVSELKFLSFSRNNDNIYTGIIPSELGDLVKMEELWMHGNQFTGTIPTELGFMNTMRDMRLHLNKLTGTIPSEFYEFGFLFRLDLFSNHLTGTLQTEIGAFRKMQQLRVSRNQFTGTIPTEIANLSALLLGWFHSNKFVGSLPEEICALRPKPLVRLQTDCFPDGNAPNPCKCCTSCCNRDTEICTILDDNA